YARVPMESLMVAGHPTLLVSTAVSTDFSAYSSAVRMEHTRANIGGAAGALIVQAERLGVDPASVSYGDVRQELQSRGYKVGLLN
ncbi:MAG TPA: FAD-dependent oxidoreductase, partial [Thermoleophilia bacterium]